MNEVKAIKIPWSEVSEKLQIEIEAILERKLKCFAKPDDDYYWCVGFPEGRVPLSEILKILESLNASKYERLDSVPPEIEHAVDVSCLGMSASELLLRRSLGYRWETTHIEKDALWILGEMDGDQNET